MRGDKIAGLEVKEWSLQTFSRQVSLLPVVPGFFSLVRTDGVSEWEKGESYRQFEVRRASRREREEDHVCWN